MSYINKKLYAFTEAGSTELHRKRSDGRMKTYSSATDYRAWSDTSEDRRQHILGLVNGEIGKGLTLGKVVPVEAIINILLANANKFIKRLQREIEELRNLLNQHGIYYEEKPISKIDLQTQWIPAEAEEIVPVEVRAGEVESKISDSKAKGSIGSRISAPKSVTSEGRGSRVSGEGVDKTPEEAAVIGSSSSKAKESVQGEETEETNLEGVLEKESNVIGPAVTGSRSSEAKASVQGDEIETDLARVPEKASNISSKSKTSVQGDETEIDPVGVPEKESINSKGSRMSGAPEAVLVEGKDSKVSGPLSVTGSKISSRSGGTKGSRISGSGVGKQEEVAAESEVSGKISSPPLGMEYEIALEAITRLEKIKDIVEGGGGGEALGQNENNLQERLSHLEGLEEEVKNLRNKAIATVQSSGDSSNRDELLAKINDLEKENIKSKCDLKELEILQVERNCLKMRVDDLSKLLEVTNTECESYKNKCEKLEALEDERNELRAKAERGEQLEYERTMLMKEIEDCKCCMHNQEEEIKKLQCHIHCLTEDLDKREEETKVQVLTMKTHIEKKDAIVDNSEEDAIVNNSEEISCETTCLRSRIDELEDEVVYYQKILTIKDDDYKTTVAKLHNVEDSKRRLEENHRVLLDSLKAEKDNSTRLEETLQKAIKNDCHLQQMLMLAKTAIKSITQKLEKKEFVEVGRLEAEKEIYLRKIKELQEGMPEQSFATLTTQ